MKYMKVKISALLSAAVVLSLLLSGCGDKSERIKADAGVTSENEYEKTAPSADMTEEPSENIEIVTEAGETVSSDSEEYSESGQTYVLNINTKRFHYPDCPSVKEIKEKNRRSFSGTREEAIELGYTPCGACKP